MKAKNSEVMGFFGPQTAPSGTVLPRSSQNLGSMNTNSKPVSLSAGTSSWALRWIGRLAAITLMVVAVRVEAATERTWVGDGDTGIWSDTLNWSASPVTGDILKFSYPYNNTDCQNDLSGLARIGDMTISAVGFSITGYPLQLGGNWTVQESATWGINSTVYQDIGLNTWAGKTLTFNGTVDLNGKILSITGEGDTVMAGAIGGDTGIFDVQGSQTSGSCTLAAVNSYKGLTRLSAGTLKLNVNNAIPRVNSDFNYIDFVGFLVATLDLNGKNLAVNALIERGYVKCNAGSATLTIGSSYSTFTSSDWGYAGSIQGPISLVKDGTSLFYLAPANAANSYSGDTWIQGGTLQIRVDNASIPYGSGKGNVTIDSGAFLDLKGASANVNGLSGAGKVVNSHTTTAATLTVGNNDATSSFSGAIDDSGGTPTLALTKEGVGNLTLSGTSTFRGITRVNAGKLILTGALGSAGAVRVGSPGTGGTLSGNGTIAGTVRIYNTGTIAPGTSPGTLSTGAETWENGGAYEFEINYANTTTTDTYKGKDPGWDWLNINGALTVSATSVGAKFTIKLKSLTSGNVAGALANWNPRNDYRWTIATASGGVVTFDAAAFIVDTSAFTPYNSLGGGVFTVEKSGNNIDLVFTHSYIYASAASYSRARSTYIRIPIDDLLSRFTVGDVARELTVVGTGDQTTVPTYTVTLPSATGYILLAQSGNNTEVFNYTVRALNDAVHTSSSTITVSVTNAYTTASEIYQSGGNSVTVKFSGIPGLKYVVERSQTINPGSWTTVQTKSPLTGNGIWTYSEVPPYNPTYYRSRQSE